MKKSQKERKGGHRNRKKGGFRRIPTFIIKKRKGKERRPLLINIFTLEEGERKKTTKREDFLPTYRKWLENGRGGKKKK